MGAGLTLLRAWANAGTRIKPSDGKIDQGWLAGEQPPVEYENERMYSRDTLVNQITAYLNAGVPLSDVVTNATSSLTITGTSFISRLDVNGLDVYNRGLFGTDEYHHFHDKNGADFVQNASGSQVNGVQCVSVDITGRTWSLFRTITTDVPAVPMYSYEIDAAVNFKILGTAGGSTRVIGVTLLDGGQAETPYQYFTDYVTSPNGGQIDSIRVIRHSPTPPSYDRMILHVVAENIPGTTL